MKAMDLKVGQEFFVKTKYDYSLQRNHYRVIGTLAETRMVPCLVLVRIRWPKLPNGQIDYMNALFRYEYSDNGKPMAWSFVDGLTEVESVR